MVLTPQHRPRLVVGILTDEDKDLVVRISEEHGDGERLKDMRQQSKTSSLGRAGDRDLRTYEYDHDDKCSQVRGSGHPHADEAVMFSRDHIPQKA